MGKNYSLVAFSTKLLNLVATGAKDSTRSDSQAVDCGHGDHGLAVAICPGSPVGHFGFVTARTKLALNVAHLAVTEIRLGQPSVPIDYARNR